MKLYRHVPIRPGPRCGLFDIGKDAALQARANELPRTRMQFAGLATHHAEHWWTERGLAEFDDLIGGLTALWCLQGAGMRCVSHDFDLPDDWEEVADQWAWKPRACNRLLLSNPLSVPVQPEGYFLEYTDIWQVAFLVENGKSLLYRVGRVQAGDSEV